MKLVKNISLFYKVGKSDKVYDVDLCELSTQQPDRYLVNFRYGKRGASLREGTKTKDPIDLETAQQIFDSIVVAKTNKGYRVEGDIAASESQSKAASHHSPDIPNQASGISTYLAAELLKQSDSKKRARLLWRLGNLQQSDHVSKLIQKTTTSTWLEQYALVFALCRSSDQGDNSAITVLARLGDSPEASVSDFAFDALLHISTPTNRQDLLKSETKNLTNELMEIVAGSPTLQSPPEAPLLTTDQTQISDQIMSKAPGHLLINYFEQATANSDTASKQLIALYRLSSSYPHLHSQLIGLLKVLPFKPPFFKAVRHVFKVAEMTLDASMFGVISYRLNISSSLYNAGGSHCFLNDHGYLKIKPEQKKTNPKLAYSQQTRQYLRRRSWRSLRRLAEAGNRAYVPMAIEQLLQVTDADIKDHASPGDLQGHDVQRTAGSYAPFSHHFAISHIIYGNSQAYVATGQGASWKLRGNTAEDHKLRTELYPELWDNQVALVLPLLLGSKSHDIHKFVIRLLKDHPDVAQGMSLPTLLGLLNLPYPETNQLARNVAGTRLQKNGYDGELLLALLSCVVPESRLMAIEHLGNYETQWKNDTRFIAQQFFIEFEDTAAWRNSHLSPASVNLSINDQNAILSNIIERSFELGNLSAMQHDNISTFTANILPDAAANSSLAPINRLLSEPKETMQLYGAILLVLNNVSFEEIPETLFAKISQSPWASVRAKGISLIGKQSDESLLKNPNLLLNIYKQGEHPDRNEAAPIIVRMADHDNNFATSAVQELVSLAFQGEKNEKQHEDIIQLYTVNFKPHWRHIDNNLLWRLLMAQSKAAQVIGSTLLTDSSSSERMTSLSVMQWALLGHHQASDVREYVRATYSSHVPKVRENTKEALKILDGNWLDTREFAFQYFRDNYEVQDWNPELIIYICDNNRDDVQAFGRELLQKTFSDEQGESYLLKLSQHPTTNVQLFTSNFLREHAGGKPQVIKDLQPYFITVLSQVNRARITKNRVFSFLFEEAQQDKSVAQMVTEIFSRQSITAVIEDKSILIESLLHLQKLYPDLSTPLTTKQRPIWSRSSRLKNNNTQGVV